MDPANFSYWDNTGSKFFVSLSNEAEFGWIWPPSVIEIILDNKKIGVSI